MFIDIPFSQGFNSIPELCNLVPFMFFLTICTLVKTDTSSDISTTLLVLQYVTGVVVTTAIFYNVSCKYCFQLLLSMFNSLVC